MTNDVDKCDIYYNEILLNLTQSILNTIKVCIEEHKEKTILYFGFFLKFLLEKKIDDEFKNRYVEILHEIVSDHTRLNSIISSYGANERQNFTITVEYLKNVLSHFEEIISPFETQISYCITQILTVR